MTNDIPQLSGVLTATEAREYLQDRGRPMTKSRIQALMQQGRINAEKRGRMYFTTPAALDAFLDDKRPMGARKVRFMAARDKLKDLSAEGKAVLHQLARELIRGPIDDRDLDALTVNLGTLALNRAGNDVETYRYLRNLAGL